MSHRHPASSLSFIDSAFPPQIAILNVYWMQSISSDPVIGRLFSARLIRALAEGRPQPAEQVLQVLLHWIKTQSDFAVIQQTYAMRLKLDAFAFEYASQRQAVDIYSWKILGVCSIGRRIAIKLDPSLKLDAAASWTMTKLWDWIIVEVGIEEQVACTIGLDAPELRLHFPISDLQKSVFVIFLAGAYLWPAAFPIMDSEVLNMQSLPPSNIPLI